MATTNNVILAPFIRGGFMDPRFNAHGAGEHCQGKISDLPFLVKPDEVQNAYFGYKENIDIFMLATDAKKVMNITSPPDDISNKSTLPLSRPDVVVSFDMKPEAAAKIIDAVAKKFTVSPIDGVNKHPCAYRIHAASEAMVLFLRQWKRKDGVPRISNCLTLEGAAWYFKVLNRIDLYLRMNTYCAFKDDKPSTGPRISVSSGWTRVAVDPEDLRSELTKRTKWNDIDLDMSKSNGRKSEKGIFVAKSDELKDVSFAGTEYVSVADKVFHAKPSASANSGASWGKPSDCPALPGIIFPYFDGMNVPDTSFIREIVGRRFYRTLGKDPRSQYIEFRQEIGNIGSSFHGMVIAHMLAGVEISVESQGQLFLMFDRDVYLGFVVVGAKWRIQIGAHWVIPKGVSELREALKEMKTADEILGQVVAMMNARGLMVERDSITCGEDLAKWVCMLDFGTELDDEEEEDERQKTIREFMGLLHRVDFGTEIVGISPTTVLSAISDIVSDKNSLKSQHVSFPKDFVHLPLLKTRVGLVLSRFGLRCPSFNISKPDKKVEIGPYANRLHGGEPVDVVRAGLTSILPSLILGEKPFDGAVKDMKMFLSTWTVVCSSTERSAKYRNRSYKAPVDMTVWVNGLLDLYTPFDDESKPKRQRKEKEGPSFTLSEADVDNFEITF